MATVAQHAFPETTKPLRDECTRLVEKGLTNGKLTAALYRRICDDEELLPMAAFLAAEVLVRSVRNTERRRVERSTDTTQTGLAKQYSEETQREVESACAGYYRWPLFGGEELGEATREEVIMSADKWHVQAATGWKRAMFARIVASGMRDGQKVKEAYTEEQLEALMERAEKEAVRRE